MMEKIKDVHTEHCCARHGCKYGYTLCAVASGEKEQSFRCEQCEYELTKTDWIDKIVRAFFNMKDPDDCKQANKLIDALVAKAKEVL